jgi:hypothetical protein
MNFKLYCLKWDEAQVIEIDSNTPNLKKLNQQLINIQEEIVATYYEIQNKNWGVKKLGNAIRYNKNLKNYFDNLNMEFYISKLTENKRYFIKKFIDLTLTRKDNDIYFFILNKEFGKTSNLVDGTFITIHDIRKELNLFTKSFIPKYEISNIFFIEVLGFTGYFFKEVSGFKYIDKIK